MKVIMSLEIVDLQTGVYRMAIKGNTRDYRGIILILSNGEKIILNRRLLESISNGKREEKILAMIAEKLNLTQEDLLI
jgi:hypothetical protein